MDTRNIYQSNSSQIFGTTTLILTDPRIDHQPLRESSYVNIPTIAFCNTDSPLIHVDVAIPCNNRGKHSIGLMWWLLAREVLFLKNAIPRGQPWEVMTDLFFYRDPTEEDKEEAETDKAATFGGQPQPEGSWGAVGENWDGTAETSWNATPESAEQWSATKTWDEQ